MNRRPLDWTFYFHLLGLIDKCIGTKSPKYRRLYGDMIRSATRIHVWDLRQHGLLPAKGPFDIRRMPELLEKIA